MCVVNSRRIMPPGVVLPETGQSVLSTHTNEFAIFSFGWKESRSIETRSVVQQSLSLLASLLHPNSCFSTAEECSLQQECCLGWMVLLCFRQLCPAAIISIQSLQHELIKVTPIPVRKMTADRHTIAIRIVNDFICSDISQLQRYLYSRIYIPNSVFFRIGIFVLPCIMSNKPIFSCKFVFLLLINKNNR